VLSLVTLWTNRFIVAELRVDSNVLSFAQLGMSVVCGIASELYLVGWVVCLGGLAKVMRDGLQDMVILGGVRILTILLGLTALKYISVSFTRASLHVGRLRYDMECANDPLSNPTETVKSSAPFFTVVLTYFLIGQRTGWRVNLSLVPIVVGLVFCSLSDSSFHIIGFIAALGSNCVDCLQNVLTKRLLNRAYTYVAFLLVYYAHTGPDVSASRSVSQLQLYTSIIATGMQLTYLVYNWISSPRNTALPSKNGEQEHSMLYLFVLLLLAGLGFYLQSAFAYVLMSLVSPVTHSVANCVKRALLITLSIYYYGDVVSALNSFGMVLVIAGVYVFNVASRIERAAENPSVVPAQKAAHSVMPAAPAASESPTKSDQVIEKRTAASFSEIVIENRKRMMSQGD
jgi:solute carrier family 35, member E2